VVKFDSTAYLRKEKIMKKVFTMSILIFLIFLVAGGCQQKTRRIIIGEPVVVATETIGPEGGTITITKEGDPLNGYSITVPEGAYDESQSFTVSYSPILDHTFGENFNPIAPLITVENGGGYAKKSMIVKIPVEVPEGHFAMAFFYDDKTGELQGVSMRKSEKNLLTVATKHFSNMAVSSAAKKVFEGEISSGFEQGVDNWQFTNWGSYVAAGGQCAGQSIAAMYYYSEKKVKEKKPSLFGLYDNYNNPYQKTPDIEFDDVLAYRLCSMAQKVSVDIELGAVAKDPSVLFSDVSEEDLDDESTFHAFAGSMVVSDMPQLMCVWKEDKNDKRVGHALIVYKCSGNELYVSDPNYPSGPGSKDRKVVYDPVAKQFKGYDTARNAGEAGEHFDVIEYMGALTTFDTAPIKKLWKEFEDGTVGDGTFPRYTIVVEETFPDGNTADIGLIDDYETTNQKIKVYIDPTDFEPQVTLYRGTPPPAQKGVTTIGSQTIEIPLSEGVNSLGFHVEGKVKEGKDAGRYVWVGFTWVNVIRKKAASTTTTTVEATTSSSSSTTTTTIAPTGDRFKDNGDGTVTDTITGLFWLKNANPFGYQTWAMAVRYCQELASGKKGLTDGSNAGQWRLPTIEELESIGTDPPVVWESGNPPVTWTKPGAPFTGVYTYYWSGTSYSGSTTEGWWIYMETGAVGYPIAESGSCLVWPVRDGN